MGNAGVRTRAKERLGTVLAGKYELERLIATGGMGAVYAAWQPFLQRRVAVKILHADLVHCDEHTERFLRESRMASALNHPNIVTVLDGGLAEDGAPYLADHLRHGVGALCSNVIKIYRYLLTGVWGIRYIFIGTGAE